MHWQAYCTDKTRRRSNKNSDKSALSVLFASSLESDNSKNLEEAMKKLFTKIALSTVMLLALGMLVSGAAFASARGKANARGGGTVKVQICHLNGNGTYNVLTVSQSALPAHLAHGDGLPGAIVGEIGFQDDCTPVAATRVESPLPVLLDPFAWTYVSCPVGSTVVGGGYYAPENVTAADTLVSMAADPNAPSYPVYPPYSFGTDEVGWVVMNGSDAQTLTVYVLCVAPPAPIP
jgi:hypothetical protein